MTKYDMWLKQDDPNGPLILCLDEALRPNIECDNCHRKVSGGLQNLDTGVFWCKKCCKTQEVA